MTISISSGFADSHLAIQNLHKKFNQHVALDQISLEINKGEFVCLLGPSGCGKTTLLRCVAGLESQDEGSIFSGKRDISMLPPQARDYGILFQSYALFPNLTVAQNIAYGLAGSSKDQIRARVSEMLELVGLSSSAKKYPGQLSGGQQQRVALARALAPAPSLLLLDEPMSALDARVREHLCTELRNLQKSLGITTLMVTHNQDEAMLMADRIAIMHEGKIEQYATAKEIYQKPATPFVAEFVGQGNWLPFIRGTNGKAFIGNQELQLAQPLQQEQGRLFCRPEGVHVNPLGGSPNQFSAQVHNITFLGSRCLMRFELDTLPGHPLQAELAPPEVALLGGGRIHVGLPAENLKIFA